MRALVIGGAASGKSACAESLALAGPAPRVYLATMETAGADARARIERHRALRAQKGFETWERARGLAGLGVPGGEPAGTVLLECLGTLVANEMFCAREARGEDAVVADVLAGVMVLERRFATVVAVTNDVFADGVAYDATTQTYLRALARVNAELAGRFERVVEVVCGIALERKPPAMR